MDAHNHQPEPPPQEPDEPTARLTSIRINAWMWREVREEAARRHMSAAEYVREAVAYRLSYDWAQRIDDDEVIERLKKLDRRLGWHRY